MSFLEYFLRFILVDFHLKYFRVFYRITVRISQKFGYLQMCRSLVKPLFGTPGFFSRVQGFIIRSVAILISTVIMLIIIGFGILFYLSIFISFYFIFKENIALGILYIGSIFLIKALNFMYYPIASINDLSDKQQYVHSGDITHRSFIRKLQDAEYDSAVDQLFENKFVLNFIERSEMPLNELVTYFKAEVSKYSYEDYLHEMVKINKNVKFRHLKHQLFFVAILFVIDKDYKFISKFNLNRDKLEKYLLISSYYIRHSYRIWQDEYKLPPAGGLDKDWAVGYTAELNRAGTDLTKAALQGFMPKLIGRNDVQQKAIETLTKSSRSNLLLLGENGSGFII